MIHFTCMDCQRGFTATSYEEAKVEHEEQEQARVHGRTIVKVDFDEAVDHGSFACARYCPYCGGESIEAV